ncbi:MAG: AmmeMemoRadiSam system protein B [Spirochaetes bacterium GWF1_31_7]|nr:MAG: AmmeMemoRadiSam system protein B [Spirochaetes bacterium GWE1_32_154]OHD51367.1 MAG: AmmeMemoRadiSam system protein B [Spirochaetes bacterium GWE2_31_10]OHD53093.1 MAG: AmmeMemoRadiSam system protein B [Spirochaetes bacterium GWF1_31_7]HBD94488.1 AmmeMemoRadiSam system protein B [Spirochaetia bacterium]HBI36133.1 AmmeMemoRadiSam system protein B [Spirochaetia bacterium]
MNRPMLLAYEGWYPENHAECVKEIKKYIHEDKESSKEHLKAVVSPHAGWRFCGNISVNIIKRLSQYVTPEITTLFIFGGHLPAYANPIVETFDKAHTPLGYLDCDREAVSLLLENSYVHKKDFVQDNSIEVLLPLVKYFFGDIKIVCIYMPPSEKIYKVLDIIDEHYRGKALYIGSTDLTHYGHNYHFTKDTEGLDPVEWVKYINDHNYIELLLKMQGSESMEYAIKNSSACSAGAATSALYLSGCQGVERGELFGYSTSYDILKSESFVGYAGIIY